jgi:hypothetical protein
MIDMRFQMREIGPTPKHIRRELPKLKKYAFRRVATEFHRQTWARKHFTQRGATEYGYEPREGQPGRPHPEGFQRSYTGRKLRKEGHTYPLVYSGRSRLLARFPRISATSKKATIRIPFPALALQRATAHIDMQEELETISRPDTEDIVKRFQAVVMRGVKKIRTRSTTKIG